MRGTEDGFTADKFHKLCDRKGPTLTVIKVENDYLHDSIFGGYTTLSWESPMLPVDLPDPKAFLFSLNHETIHSVKKSYSAVTHRKDSLAIFGAGYDISLSNNCNQNTNSRSYFGCYYELPETMEVGTEEAKTYLAGLFNFNVKELEVFQIIWKDYEQ